MPECMGLATLTSLGKEKLRFNYIGSVVEIECYRRGFCEPR